MSATRQVSEQRVADGATTDMPNRASFMGERVKSDIHGLHYENTVRGRMFAYGISSQALLINSNATGFPTIWNPAGSGMIFIPTKVCISFISSGTTIGALNWHITLNAGATIGAAAPILTFTKVAATNCSVGGPSNRASAMLFAPTTVTFTTAPAYLDAVGINLGTNAPTGTGTYEAKQDGSIVIWPGQALSMCYTVTTSTSLWAQTIYGLELPMPTIN